MPTQPSLVALLPLLQQPPPGMLAHSSPALCCTAATAATAAAAWLLLAPLGVAQESLTVVKSCLHSSCCPCPCLGVPPVAKLCRPRLGHLQDCRGAALQRPAVKEVHTGGRSVAKADEKRQRQQRSGREAAAAALAARDVSAARLPHHVGLWYSWGQQQGNAGNPSSGWLVRQQLTDLTALPSSRNRPYMGPRVLYLGE
jgi:hypothetical protein